MLHCKGLDTEQFRRGSLLLPGGREGFREEVAGLEEQVSLERL